MKLLLDTHALLWAVITPERLSKTARETIDDRQNTVYVSVINAWEIIIKGGLGKLEFDIDPGSFFKRELSNNDYQLLNVELSHVIAVAQLPDLHKDPFDRLLVAQAKTEDLTLVTDDELLTRYEITTMW